MIYKKLTLIVLRSFVLFSNAWPNLAEIENTLTKENSDFRSDTYSDSTENLTNYRDPVQNRQAKFEIVQNQMNKTRPFSISAHQLILPNIVKRSVNTKSDYSGENNKESATLSNKIVKEQTSGCHGCPNQQLVDSVQKDTLRLMRLNYVKEQILKKLNLNEPPITSNMPTHRLPSALTRELAGPTRHDRRQDEDEDDFFGQTEEVIVFLEDVKNNCVMNQTDQHTCFTFQFPHETSHKKVRGAELWIKIKKSLYREETFWITGPLTDLVSFRMHDHTIKDGWLKLNISSIMLNWHQNYSRTRSSTTTPLYSFQVGCRSCSRRTLLDSQFEINTPVSKPFVVVHLGAESMRKRSRRNINCTPGFSECCRESFIVSFEEIGWNTWITEPRQYEAFYCKGSCINVNGITYSMAHHTSILQRYIQVYGVNNRTEQLVPCCSASELGPMSLIYIMDNTTIHRILPKMVVKSCGCR